jgi:hypothetical protein
VKAVALVLVLVLLAPPVLADVEGSAREDVSFCTAPTASDSSDECFAEGQEAPVQPSPQSAPETRQETQQPPAPPPPQEPPQEPAPPKEPPPKRPSLKPRDFWKDIKVEAKRYAADSWAIVTAPLHWDGADWTRFGGVVVLVGGLMLADKSIDREAQQNRSRFTDRVSDATTSLGGAWASNLGVGYLVAG